MGRWLSTTRRIAAATREREAEAATRPSRRSAISPNSSGVNACTSATIASTRTERSVISVPEAKLLRLRGQLVEDRLLARFDLRMRHAAAGTKRRECLEQ